MIEYTQTELRIMAVFSAIGMLFSYLVGGFSNALVALLVLIVTDYSTGMIAAWLTHSVDSQKGFEGIKRKAVMLAVVVVTHWLDVALGLPNTFKNMAIFAYIGNEGISITENIDRMGYGKYVPSFLREKLIQLREEKGVTK